MNKEELYGLYTTKENEILKIFEAKDYSSKKAKKLIKEMENIAIEINKINHCYWDKECWVYDIFKKIPARKDLTGNALTNYYAEELNKLNGVLVEKIDNECGRTNYRIDVVTPYAIYSYFLSRGYGHCCSFGKVGDRKAKSYIIVCKNHICELVYGNTIEKLRTQYDRNILDKKPIND